MRHRDAWPEDSCAENQSADAPVVGSYGYQVDDDVEVRDSGDWTRGYVSKFGDEHLPFVKTPLYTQAYSFSHYRMVRAVDHEHIGEDHPSTLPHLRTATAAAQLLGVRGGGLLRFLSNHPPARTEWRLDCAPERQTWPVYQVRDECAVIRRYLNDGDVVHAFPPAAVPPRSQWLHLVDGGFALRHHHTGPCGFRRSFTQRLVGTWELNMDEEAAAEAVAVKVAQHHGSLSVSLPEELVSFPLDELPAEQRVGPTADCTHVVEKLLCLDGPLWKDGRTFVGMRTGGDLRVLFRCADQEEMQSATGTRVSRSQTSYAEHGDPGTTDPGYAGLRNLGNTCFMNAATQCLSHTTELRKYFTSQYRQHINRDNPLGSGGKLAHAFSALVKRLWGGRYRSVDPRDFKKAVGDVAARFAGYEQHDSQELLSCVVDTLHEDVNLVRDKEYCEVPPDEDKVPLVERAERAWDRRLRRDRSHVQDIFCGQLLSKLRCDACEHSVSSFDPYMLLSVPIPPANEGKPNYPIPYLYIPLDRSKDCVGRAVDGSAGPLLMYLQKPIQADLQIESDCGSAEVPEVHLCIWRKGTGFDTSSAVQTGPGVEVHAYERPPETSDEIVLLIEHRNDAEMTVGETFTVLHVPLSATDAKVWDALVKTFPDADMADNISEFRCSRGGGVFQRGGTEQSLVYSSFRTVHGCAVWKDEKVLCRLNRNRTNLPAFTRAARLWRCHHDGPDLEMCLALHNEEEQLDEMNTWYCPKCTEHRRAFKTLTLWTVPDTLVVHLKRFSYTTPDAYWGHRRKKVDTSVGFPLRGLDLAPYVSPSSPASGSEPMLYDLYGVVLHFGGASSGHYTAYALAAEGWACFDDQYVSKKTESEVARATSSAYLLFYRRRVETDEDVGGSAAARDDAAPAAAAAAAAAAGDGCRADGCCGGDDGGGGENGSKLLFYC